MDKVQHSLIRGGKTVGIFVSDMIRIEGKPHLLFQWSRHEGDVEVPVEVVVPLDPQFLHEGPYGDANYLYELPVEDPQPYH